MSPPMSSRSSSRRRRKAFIFITVLEGTHLCAASSQPRANPLNLPSLQHAKQRHGFDLSLLSTRSRKAVWLRGGESDRGGGGSEEGEEEAAKAAEEEGASNGDLLEVRGGSSSSDSPEVTLPPSSDSRPTSRKPSLSFRRGSTVAHPDGQISTLWPMTSAFMYYLAMALVIPVLPKLVNNLLGDEGKVTPRSATVYGLLSSIDSFFTFLTVNLWANFSDRYGRKPFMALAAVGLGTGFVITGMSKGTTGLMLAALVDGLTSCMTGIGTAAVGDCVSFTRSGNAVTNKGDLAASFGVFQGLIGIAFTFGFPLGGMLGAKMGYRVPVAMAAGLCAVNLALVLCFMPEPLPKSRRNPNKVDLRKANPIGAARMSGRNAFIGGLGCVYVLLWAANAGLQINWMNYTTHKFAWNTAAQGASLAWLGIMMAAAPKVIIPRIGVRNALQWGLVVYAFAQVLIGMAPAGSPVGSLCLAIGLTLTAVGGIAFPATQALLSQQVGIGEKGAMIGASDTVRTITTMVATPLMAALFGFCVGGGGKGGGAVGDTPAVRGMRVAGGSYVVGGGLVLMAWLGSHVVFSKYGHLNRAEENGDGDGGGGKEGGGGGHEGPGGERGG